MAELKINIPDNIVSEIVLAISTQRGYDLRENKSQTRVDFIKQTIIDSLKRDYKMYKKFELRTAEAQVKLDADELMNVIE